MSAQANPRPEPCPRTLPIICKPPPFSEKLSITQKSAEQWQGLACIIHEPSRKTLEIHIQRGFQRFSDFDSVFLYTISGTKRAEEFEICSKSW
jgi:L-amino acid N-acyltransferase YncA